MSNKQALLDCTFSWGKTCRLYRDSIEIAGKSYNLDDLTYIHPTYRELFGVASARLELCFGLRRLTLRGITDPEAARQMVSHLRPYAEQSGPDTISHRLRTRATQARDLARVQAKTWERTQKLPVLLDAPRPDAPAPSVEPATSPAPEPGETTPATSPSSASSPLVDAFDDFLDVAEQSTLHIPASALPALAPPSLPAPEEAPGLSQKTCSPASSSPESNPPVPLPDAPVPDQEADPLAGSSTPNQAATLTDVPTPAQSIILADAPVPDQAAPLTSSSPSDQPAVPASTEPCPLPERPTLPIPADTASAPAQATSTDSAPEPAGSTLSQEGEPVPPAELPAQVRLARPPLLKKRLPRITRFELPLRPVQLVNPRAALAQSAEELHAENGQEAQVPSPSLTRQEVPGLADTQEEQKNAPLASETPDPGEQTGITSSVPLLAQKSAARVTEGQKNMPEKKTLAKRSAHLPLLKSNLLPIIQAPVRLQPGEYAHYSIEAALRSDRLADSEHVSCPPLDHGLLILTNRRIFYLGKRCQLILAYTHLGHVSLLPEAIALHIEGQLRRIIMEIEHSQEWASRIEQLTLIARRSPQLAPMFVLPGVKPPAPVPVTLKRAALKHPPARKDAPPSPADAPVSADLRIVEATTIELAPRIDQRIIETTTVEFAPDTDQNIVEATTITFGPRTTQRIVEATTIAFDLQAAQNIVEATTVEFGPQTASSVAEIPTMDLGSPILDQLADVITLKFPPLAEQKIEDQVTSEFPPLATAEIEHVVTCEFPLPAKPGIENQVTDAFPPLPGAKGEHVATHERSPLAEQETIEMTRVFSREQRHYTTADTLKLPPGDSDEGISSVGEVDEEVTGKSAVLFAHEEEPMEIGTPALHEQEEEDATSKSAAIVAHARAWQEEDERTIPLRLRAIAALSAQSLHPGAGQASERKLHRSSAQNRVLSRARFPQKRR